MKLNKVKRKIMGNIYANNNDFKISVEDVEIKLVECCTYLGQFLTTDNNIAKEVSRRIGQGWATFGQSSHLLNDKKTPMCLKRKIVNGVILQAMTCGSETWSLANKQRERLAVAQRNMERSMLGITRKEKRRNEWIREKTEVDDIMEKVDVMK